MNKYDFDARIIWLSSKEYLNWMRGFYGVMGALCGLLATFLIIYLFVISTISLDIKYKDLVIFSILVAGAVAGLCVGIIRTRRIVINDIKSVEEERKSFRLEMELLKKEKKK